MGRASFSDGVFIVVLAGCYNNCVMCFNIYLDCFLMTRSVTLEKREMASWLFPVVSLKTFLR